jgi:hypothetical protein
LIETKSDGMLPSALRRRSVGYFAIGATDVHSHPPDEGLSGAAAVQHHRDLGRLWDVYSLSSVVRRLLILPRWDHPHRAEHEDRHCILS